jgi:hypothetical protein
MPARIRTSGRLGVWKIAKMRHRGGRLYTYTRHCEESQTGTAHLQQLPLDLALLPPPPSQQQSYSSQLTWTASSRSPPKPAQPPSRHRLLYRTSGHTLAAAHAVEKCHKIPLRTPPPSPTSPTTSLFRFLTYAPLWPNNRVHLVHVHDEPPGTEDSRVSEVNVEGRENHVPRGKHGRWWREGRTSATCTRSR